MIYLLKNAEIYAPQSIGVNDLLIGGGKILAIAPTVVLPDKKKGEIVDCKRLKITTGFIDAHVHIAGAGGEGGPASRTPEVQLSSFIESGVTSVVGCLGTDGMTRNIESVLMKAKALRSEGISAWIYTGAYQVPTPTITGDVGRDIALFEEIIGAGEIALSDHRSSCPTTAELIRLAEHARVGGMLGGKAGILNIHFGDAKNPFKPLYDAAKSSELNLKQFLPTHCNRNDYIFSDAMEYGKKSWVDITTSSYPVYPQYEIKPSVAFAELIKNGVPIEHITFTSDAGGSLPDFDENGKLIQVESATSISMLTEFVDMIKAGISIETALKPVSYNPAKILKLHTKGRIELNADADIICFDNEFKIKHLFANGNKMKYNYKAIVKGTYE